MGLFGIGGGSSRSSSTQEQWSDSASQSVDTSSQRSSQLGISGSEQTVFGADTFSQLYGGAGGAAANIAANPFLSEAAMSMFTSGSAFMNQIAGLQGGAEQDYLQRTMEGRDRDNVQARKQVLQEDVGRLFREELNPAISSQSVLSGGLGGGRQGVAQTGAARVAAEQYRRGAVDIEQAALERRDQAARDLYAQKIGGAQAGLAATQQVGGLAETAAMAELAPYERLSQILGGPTTLTSSFGYNTGTSEAQSYGAASSVSSSYGYGRSSSKDKNFSFGF